MTSNTPAALFSKVDLRCKVLVPHDPEFQQRQESFWSFYSRSIEPACILCPESASEVSQILQILIANSQKFAIRSGGHTQWKGANNIQDGVTIDLKALNHVTLHEPSATVDLGPGASWAHVYAELKKSGRVVAGGRNGKVGVGGLILGGGKTFFSGRRGFACDDVISYDVVLADGRIVTADATQHSDLFMALRGGSGNFGIVVNFKMNCFHNSGIWGGLRIHAKELEHSALEMLQDFTTAFRDDADSMLLLFVGFSVSLLSAPQEKRTVVMEALISVTANEKAKAFDKFLTLPPLLDTCKPTTVEAMVSEYDPAPSGYYNIFFTSSLKNDTRIFRKATELHDQVVADLLDFIPEADFLTECLFQPLPTVLGQVATQHGGGNMLNLSAQKADGVIFIAIVMVKTAAQERFAYPRTKAWHDGVCQYARTIDNGVLDWVYMNYADQSQDPLGSYGPANVKKLRDVAAEYDPQQVFQKLCPGGFKISQTKVGME